jgi:hypothetical protein
MRQRNFTVSDVLSVLNKFEVIEEYSDDRPFSSYLILGYSDSKPLHIVVAVNSEDFEIHLITVYSSDSSIWDITYRRKI